jgi:hypothetical protein
MYQNIPAKDRGPVPARFAKLEAMVRQHMDTLSKVKLTKEDTIASRFYLWSAKGPLVQYMIRDWKRDSTTPYFKRLASEASLYMDYGSFLIRRYPWTFATSVLLPNVYRYAVPPAEFLEVYNMGGDSVAGMAKVWFNYKSLKIASHNNKNAKITVMNWYPFLATLINVLFFICVMGMFLFNLFRPQNKPLTTLFLLLSFFWVVNTGFSIIASPVTLRYQVLPIIITLSLVAISAEAIYKSGILVAMRCSKSSL